MERRYLCVVEIDTYAENDVEAATNAIQYIKSLDSPQVHVRPIDDSLEPWQGVDFGDTDDEGNPYVGEAKPLCFDFAD